MTASNFGNLLQGRLLTVIIGLCALLAATFITGQAPARAASSASPTIAAGSLNGTISDYTINSSGEVTKFSVRPPGGDEDGSDDVEIHVASPNSGVSESVVAAYNGEDPVTVDFTINQQDLLKYLESLTVGS